MTSEEINIYCDESCHLEHDNSKVMVLGGIMCPKSVKDTVFKDIKQIKKEHKLDFYEIKWTKISKCKIDFYKDIITYFYDNQNLRFRGLVVPDKSILNHEKYGQTHDKFYYKMYYDLLNPITRPPYKYNVFLDIKDTKGQQKVKELSSYLPKTVQKIQEVRSEEIELIQLADLLIGANEYFCNHHNSSNAKLEIVKFINDYCQKCNQKNMNETTDYCAYKFNLLNIKLSGENNCE